MSLIEDNHENSLVQMLNGDGATSYAAGEVHANPIEDIDPLDFDRDFAKIASNLRDMQAKANDEFREARERRQEVMTCMTNQSGDVDDNSIDG